MNAFTCICTSTWPTHNPQHINTQIETQTHTNTHAHPTHIYAHQPKNTISLIPNDLSLFYAPDVKCTRFNKKNAQKIAKILKPILDYRSYYTISTDTTQARTPFKNSITYYQLLTSYYLTFKPARTRYKILPSAGIHFEIPVCISNYVVKRVNKNSPQYTHECTIKITHVSLSMPFSSK